MKISTIFNPLVQKARDFKYGFVGKIFIAAIPVLGIAVPAGELAINTYFSGKLPTPHEYAVANDFDLKPETVSYLKQFDDVRIVQHGSPLKTQFCKWTRSCSDLATRGENYANVPDGIYTQLTGARTVVYLKPYQNIFSEMLVWGSTGKQHPHALEKSQYAFIWTILHELGHVETARKIGYEAYTRLPDAEREAEADKIAQPKFEREVGYAGSQYAIHFRALTQFEPSHDVLMRLYGSQSSQTSFSTISNECGVTRPYEGAKNLAANIDRVYSCLSEKPVSAKDSPELAFRKQSYVAAWDYFFKPNP